MSRAMQLICARVMYSKNTYTRMYNMWKSVDDKSRHNRTLRIMERTELSNLAYWLGPWLPEVQWSAIVRDINKEICNIWMESNSN